MLTASRRRLTWPMSLWPRAINLTEHNWLVTGGNPVMDRQGEADFSNAAIQSGCSHYLPPPTPTMAVIIF